MVLNGMSFVLSVKSVTNKDEEYNRSVFSGQQYKWICLPIELSGMNGEIAANLKRMLRLN